MLDFCMGFDFVGDVGCCVVIVVGDVVVDCVGV